MVPPQDLQGLLDNCLAIYTDQHNNLRQPNHWFDTKAASHICSFYHSPTVLPFLYSIFPTLKRKKSYGIHF